MPAFWETKSLDEMSNDEWESLCDGCGRCCLHKLEDEDTNEMYYTNVGCRLLDRESCRCSNYAQRELLVRDCLVLTHDLQSQITWLPSSCAYRRLAENRPLAWWHPLVSGSKDSVHEAGVSVRSKTTSENEVPAEDLQDHIIFWVDF